ncbi:MAG TPA: sugar phosphate isomerase/epimerase [Verrucomicrobiales bacterium]|nr:sugar phosphate isomerase/epimerase [Verrucomicrobiales bacterium]HIL70358.1 sugar phosphate isomerase/epimerase [Verrucomicrobiota bacterium]
MNPTSTTRRSFIKASVLGTAGTSIATSSVQSESATDRVEGSRFKLGVASYSLRELPLTKAISAVKALHTSFINIKSFHIPYESTATQIAAAQKEIEQAGLKIIGGGTISLRKDEDEDIRYHFEYAKRCGMPLMVIAPTKKTLPRIEKFVKEYNIKVAVHNHGPEDKHFPGPQDVLPFISTMDPRVGLCIDLGHTARTGVNVVEAIAQSGSRALDFHMKDLRNLSNKHSQCIVGEGALPIADIFKQLIRMNYTGYVNLEYEIDADNPLPGMKQSFSYMRGVLHGLSA